jgi:hypothetical protein
MMEDMSSTDVELLRIEIETLWVPDEKGRLLRVRSRTFRAAPELVLAVGADGGQCLAFGVAVPDLVAHELEAIVSAVAAGADPAAPPSSVARCRELLQDAFGPVILTSGLSYLIPPGVTFSSTAAVTRADDGAVRKMRLRSRGKADPPRRAGVFAHGDMLYIAPTHTSSENRPFPGEPITHVSMESTREQIGRAPSRSSRDNGCLYVCATVRGCRSVYARATTMSSALRFSMAMKAIALGRRLEDQRIFPARAHNAGLPRRSKSSRRAVAAITPLRMRPSDNLV